MDRRPPTGSDAQPWEPATAADIAAVAALAGDAMTVEGDVAAIVEQRRDGDVCGEIVAWAWVIDHERSHVLLVDHPRRRVWVPPGGRARPGEHPRSCAARELLEETGVSGELLSRDAALVDAVRSETPDGVACTNFGVAYLFVADRGAPLSPEPGQDARWWPLAAPPRRRADHHWRRLTAALRSSLPSSPGSGPAGRGTRPPR